MAHGVHEILEQNNQVYYDRQMHHKKRATAAVHNFTAKQKSVNRLYYNK